MSGALDKLIEPDNMLLSIVSWWVSAANWPHTVKCNILWSSGSIGSKCINGQVLVWCSNDNIDSWISDTAVHVGYVVAEGLDWTGELVGEVSLREDEDTMGISDGSVSVDVAIINIGIDADTGTCW